MMELIVQHARLGSLVLFSGFFAVTILWLFLPGKKQEFDSEARRILEADHD